MTGPRAARIGCSGWNYADWRGGLYPAGLPQRRWLERYAEVFDTVEVNATFYRLPARESVCAWVRHTPPDFVFAAKASRYLTHMKRLTDMDRGVRRYLERIEPLIESGRLGPVLWQLPERFARDDARLGFALEHLPPGRHAFELRHPSWMDDAVFDLLRRHGVALAVGHHPRRPWQRHVVTADFAFVRFHQGERGRQGNYSERELDEWARRLDGWRRHQELYAYFNNDRHGHAVRNAVGLRRRLERLAGGGRGPAEDGSPGRARRRPRR